MTNEQLEPQNLNGNLLAWALEEQTVNRVKSYGKVQTLKKRKVDTRRMVEGMKNQMHKIRDSKRYHRFQIITHEGIVGTVYVPKNIESIPMSITLEYAGKE